jgi:hypothetical protein
MFGGFDNVVGFANDTREYDGVNWTQVTTASSPSARDAHAMTYDSARGKVVIFGGYDGSNVNDTWEYDVFSSSATQYGNGCGNPALGFWPNLNPIIGTTARAMITNPPTPLAAVAMGFSDTHLGSLPILPLSLAFTGMPGCYLLQSNDVFGLPVTPITPSLLWFDAAIPVNAALLGLHFYIQAYCFAPGANPLQIIASNGIDWLIGHH